MKKTITWVVILVVVLGGGVAAYAYLQNGNDIPQYTTQAVVRGDLEQTVEATGSVASADDLNLSFKRSGRVQDILVETGDSVAAGDVLARILDQALLSDIDRARAQVISAQAKLDELLAGASAEDTKVKEEAVARARVTLTSALTTLNNEQIELEQTRQIYIDTALQELSDAIFVIDFSLNTVEDAILDDEADADFKTTNTTALQTAEVQYSIGVTSLNTARVKYDEAIAAERVADSLEALVAVRSALDTTVKLVDSGFSALSGAIATIDFTQTTIDSYTTSFNSRATALATEKTSIQTSITNLTTGIQTLSAAVDAAQAKVDDARQALSLAEAELNALIAPPQEFEIRQQQASVLQAEADLRSAQSLLDDTAITAPVTGVITQVEKEQGEIAAANETVITMIGDSRLLIDVDIPESDINKVAINAPVEITLDAFGLDRRFTGTVSFIEPSERVIQDVVYYRVTVVFSDEYSEIKPGMTADVIIDTAQRSNILTVPLRAVIINQDGSKYVRVLENDTAVRREITTGLRGDEGDIEVLSGLDEGELVITGEIDG